MEHAEDSWATEARLSGTCARGVLLANPNLGLVPLLAKEGTKVSLSSLAQGQLIIHICSHWVPLDPET